MLVGLVAACFVAIWLTMAHPVLLDALRFTSSDAGAKPWTLLTYPFGSSPASFVSVLFSGLWLWSIGGAVEADLRASRYLAAWLTFTLLGSLAILLGAAVLKSQGVLFGPLIPIAALTVVWGTRNPQVMVRLMFVLPVTGMWVAFIAAGIVLFDMGAGPGGPAMGLFACVPLLAAWAFASGRVPGLYYGSSSPKRKAWKPQEKDDRFFDDVRRREKERDERERLRKLFEGSLKDDEDDRGTNAR